MSTRQILHQLVDELPAEDISTAERILQALSVNAAPHVPLEDALLDVELDDDDFDGGLAEARAGAEAGRVVSHEEVKRRCYAAVEHIGAMITTVTQKNMVTIPAEVRRKLGIKPGWKLDWLPVEGSDEILVRVIPERGELARRLLGAGRKLSPDRDVVSELVAERAADG